MGRPVAAPVKVAAAGAVRVRLAGWVVMVGATFTVKATAWLIRAALTPLLTRTWNLAPLSAALVAAVLKLAAVAPLMSAQTVPPSLDRCH